MLKNIKNSRIRDPFFMLVMRLFWKIISNYPGLRNALMKTTKEILTTHTHIVIYFIFISYLYTPSACHIQSI